MFLPKPKAADTAVKGVERSAEEVESAHVSWNSHTLSKPETLNPKP